jgi:HTH-type transcriptional regulator/antitoxin HipB
MPARSDDLVQRVARKIAEVRAASGMTQEALAARLDIATKNVQRLESGRQNLTLKTIERVADALRVERAALLEGAVAPKNEDVGAPPSALAASGARRTRRRPPRFRRIPSR